jgi:hypothetical protein
MWIHLNNAFLSVVAHRHQPDMLLVRARVAGDIEKVFPAAVVSETLEADYLFRAVLPRPVVASVLSGLAAGIEYDNFKRSVADNDRHDAYYECWLAMRRLQLDGVTI